MTAPDDAGRRRDKALERRVAELADRASPRSAPADVAGVRSAADGEGAEALVSEDGRSALILVTLAGAASDAEDHVAELYDLVRDADGDDGYAVAMTGGATWGLEARERAESDLRRAELIGVPIAVVILLARVRRGRRRADPARPRRGRDRRRHGADRLDGRTGSRSRCSP